MCVTRSVSTTCDVRSAYAQEVFVSDGQDLAWKDASGVPDPNLNLLEVRPAASYASPCRLNRARTQFGTDAGGNPLYLAQIPHESGALCVGKAGPSLADGAHYGASRRSKEGGDR